MARTVAVIGGGISGLASALRLAARGARVTLYEGEDFLGGLGTTFPYQGGHLERFYHCVLPDDRALLGVIRELGMESELLWKPTAMGFMYRGRIYPMNTALDLLRFSPLTVPERLRMGWLGLRARAQGMNPALDLISAADWVRGMVGKRAFEILWKPLLSAKIGDHYPALPALWLSSRMSREKSSQQEVKGCLIGGYRSLIDTFERVLRERGTEIRFRTRIRAIAREGEAMALVREDGVRVRFDTVVSTSPLVQFQRMTEALALDPRLARLELDYQGVVSGVFLTRQPLTRYYWMPWVDSGVTAQGAIEMSNLVPLSRSNGLHVNYLVNYTHRGGELFRMSDADTLARYRGDLRHLFPEADASVVDQFVFRAPFVEPIWTVGYHALRPAPSVIPGRLYLACTAQVYPRVNSWNSCIEVVEEMMKQFAAETVGHAEAAA
jgi:protoporphyrinogen oxidase